MEMIPPAVVAVWAAAKLPQGDARVHADPLPVFDTQLWGICRVSGTGGE